MLRQVIANLAVAGVALGASVAGHAALVVTAPTAATVVEAGDDYATQVLGDAWDMNNSADIDTQESFDVGNQTFVGGIYSGTTTTANNSNIYPLFMGYASSINLSRGAAHPIDTSHYRYVTIKMKATQPGGKPQFTRVIALRDSSSYVAPLTVVETKFTALPNNTYTILTFDMVSNNDGVYHAWLDFPQLAGLRIDPAITNAPSPAAVNFSIDWIRLTAPATSAQKTTVTWTDTGSGPYTITAIDAAGTGTAYMLATGVSGTSFQADTSYLPPGQYQIQVSRSGATANSASFSINSPPQIAITAPSVRGDQSRDFATTVVGNPWGPFSAADLTAVHFKNVVYNMPANSFYGRPTSLDPEWIFNMGSPAKTIDTSVYRSLCFKQEVFGPRNIGTGSVARAFWTNGSGTATSQDIILDDNQGDTVVSEYCIPDLSVVGVESGGPWTGTMTGFRIDPDELTPAGGCTTADTCHDVRLDSVRLSPFAQANPGFTFTWMLADADNASLTIDIYLDPDTTPGNGNEILIGSTTAGNGAGQYVWPGGTANGTYNVLLVVDDGVNSVAQYAGGPLIVISDVIFQNGFEP